MLAAQPGRKTAEKRRICEQRIKMERRLRNRNAMTAIRDAIMQIGQRLFVTEPMRLSGAGLQKRHELIGFLPKTI